MSERVPSTEAVDPATRGLDLLATPDLVTLLARAQQRAGEAVLAQRDALARAVDAIAECVRTGGRVHYVGAGTSGRLGVLDAAECPPTFGTPNDLVQAHIAGGRDALTRAVEGAEDDAESGMATVDAAVRAGDAVVGISASGQAPFVVAALRRAHELGATTLALTSDGDSPLAQSASLVIALQTGAEPLAGSTRLVAGTAQKIVLSVLSTALMVRLGKVYDNVMVDVVATNAKLRRRAHGLVQSLAAIDADTAHDLLERSGGSAKVAVVMSRRGVDRARAQELLHAAHGSLRAVLLEP